MRKLICKWFGHRWARGPWIHDTFSLVKYRVDTCDCCGATAQWHSLVPRK
jgi:hypothetical protein